MIKFLYTLLFCCSSLMAFAIPLEKNRWHDFEGMLGNRLTHLSVFIEDDGKLSGKLCFAGQLPAWDLQGKLVDSQFQILAYENKVPVASITAAIVSGDADVLTGEWKNTKSGDKQALKLMYIASCGGDIAHRYTSIDFPDTVAEQFMQQSVNRIIQKDKKWVAANMLYPLNTSLLGKKGITIQNEQALLKYYDQIFYPDYVSRLQSVCFCGLFHNFRGLMLGRGELWIGQMPSVKGKKPRLLINAVNN